MPQGETRNPLRFRGTPLLVEGLAPFRYQDVLASNALRVSLASEAARGAAVTNVQTVPAGDTATLVRFSLPSATPAGSYSGEVSLADASYPIVAEVEGRPQLYLSPGRLTLTASRSSTVAVEMTATNGGNVAVEIAPFAAFGLFDVQGAERSIGEAFRGPAEAGQDRLNKLMDRMADEHGGLVRVQVTEGAGSLEPGDLRNLKAQVRVPDSVKPGHAYSGTCPIGNVRLYVRVEVPPDVISDAVSKEVQ
jgi:hypothetical protein